MKNTLTIVAAGAFLLLPAIGRGDVKVTADYNSNAEANAEFKFKSIPSPAGNDAASKAGFTIVEGREDSNDAGVEVLHDGKLPDDGDQPDTNFFFRDGSDGGRLLVDLGHDTSIKQVNTYSWHPGDRGPQVYQLYGATGKEPEFLATPKKGTAPDQCGWKLIATVDTKPAKGYGSGQHGVSISDTGGEIGKYRYLLFDIASPGHRGSNTFYSEIDVIDASAPASQPIAVSALKFDVKTADGKSTITIDPNKAPELADWSKEKLAPVLAEWYPKIVAMLPSNGFTAPDRFRVTIKPMGGVAYTTGRSVFASSEWLQKTINGEAVGSIVHELVHVVQQIGTYGGNSPVWLVEGTADYIRWFKYEPQSHGADLVWMKKQRNFVPRYDAGYRTSANFLNWVTEKYDKDIVMQLNVEMREGKYKEDAWKKYTGKTVQELAAEWKKEIEAELAAKPDAPEKTDKPN